MGKVNQMLPGKEDMRRLPTATFSMQVIATSGWPGCPFLPTTPCLYPGVLPTLPFVHFGLLGQTPGKESLFLLILWSFGCSPPFFPVICT